MKLQKIILLAGLSAFLIGCGSNVPLTAPATVQDRSTPMRDLAERDSAKQNPLANKTNQGNSVTTRDVAPVEVARATATLASVVYFDFDSYIVKPEGQRVLEEQAKSLGANRQLRVALAGHTDDLGGREYNLALGQKRADAVRRALSILGVTEAQMESVSYGKEKPANPSTDDAARAENRRVEISAR